MDVVDVIVVVLLAAVVLGAIARLKLFERIVVYEYECGLRYDKGRFAGVIDPGAYWLVRRNSRIDVIDMRPTTITIPGQEVIAADGVSIRSLDLVEAKDLMFSGDIKKAFAQAVTARKEGQAALERARGETAALRNLANAARVLDANPALMQLRVLQQIGGTTGNTVVLGLSGSGTPLPLREAREVKSAEVPPTDA